ncbi:MAG: (d)CMP kinase [Pirellula sp.]|jgi:cytidylate kinase|nr:(d)CMP kinase [Pirellula sp.]
MIVTIDGPAGAGKSSIAKRLADALGFEFLDTGAMYRAVTLSCLEQGVDLADASTVARIASGSDIQFDGARVMLDGRDVTREIREPRITDAIKEVADNPAVRACMVSAQVRWSQGKNAVTEGRDQGTVAFPAAECKIFLTASPEVRAKRRFYQLREKNVAADLDTILRSQIERDEHDRSRPVGALVQAADAIPLDTDSLTEDQVLERLIEIVCNRCDANQIARPTIQKATRSGCCDCETTNSR